MSTQKLLKKLRLLPTVIALGFVLLVVKGAGFALDARAQSAGTETGKPAATNEATPAKGTAAASPDAATDPAAEDDGSASAAEVDVLTSLGKRRDELDARAKELDMRENLIAAAEQRVNGKIAELKNLQGTIQGLLKQRDDAEAKQLASLVKTYSAMKAKDAARIFDTLDKDVLIAVAGAMKPDSLASILAAMQPQAAQKLTLQLADKLQLPARPQQTAMAAPPPVPVQTSPPAQTQPQAQQAIAPAASAPAAPSPAQALSAPGTNANTPPAAQSAAAASSTAPQAGTKTPNANPKAQTSAAK